MREPMSQNVGYKLVTNLLVIFVLVMGTVFTQSCSTKKVPLPPTLIINYIAGPNLNPDINSVPSPVVISVFELKNMTAFKNADFFALNDNPQKILGDDFISQTQIEARPGQTTTTTQKLSADTLYVAIIAAYRAIDNSRWRSFIELKGNKDVSIVVKLNKDGVDLKLK
jgi:type VI secretion lipoprotein, VC_A0113 family